MNFLFTNWREYHFVGKSDLVALNFCFDIFSRLFPFKHSIVYMKYIRLAAMLIYQCWMPTIINGIQQHHNGIIKCKVFCVCAKVSPSTNIRRKCMTFFFFTYIRSYRRSPLKYELHFMQMHIYSKVKNRHIPRNATESSWVKHISINGILFGIQHWIRNRTFLICFQNSCSSHCRPWN